ncbi:MULTISPECIES: hypothetical protein [unclassified Adlercreutzia]|uniref:hypothetical protein n=1 Tax=unclassified Adlercreutzia TaxID=2636013 RepID=UPI0013EC40A9|nr:MULTISPECIES: hypothetical protein [unclassified Adlercreutzia]
MGIKVVKDKVWTRIAADDADSAFIKEKVGKWEVSFSDCDTAAALCKEAVERGIVAEARYRNAAKGTIALYVNRDDEPRHRNVLAFFKEHGMLRRTKNGNYADLPFKLIFPENPNGIGNKAEAAETTATNSANGTTGANKTNDTNEAAPSLQLSTFMDVETGEFLQ